MSVVIIVLKHDNIRKNYLIGLRFGILLKGQKRKDEFVNQPFLINGSGFIYEKRFSRKKNSIYPPEYTIYGKNVRKQNCSFRKDLQLWFGTFFHRSYIFCLLMKNIIKNETNLFLSKTLISFVASLEDRFIDSLKMYNLEVIEKYNDKIFFFFNFVKIRWGLWMCRCLVNWQEPSRIMNVIGFDRRAIISRD